MSKAHPDPDPLAVEEWDFPPPVELRPAAIIRQVLVHATEVPPAWLTSRRVAPAAPPVPELPPLDPTGAVDAAPDPAAAPPKRTRRKAGTSVTAPVKRAAKPAAKRSSTRKRAAQP